MIHQIRPEWQRHVVVALWIAVAALVVVAGALLWANGHGYFNILSDRTAPLAPWPDGLQ